MCPICLTVKLQGYISLIYCTELRRIANFLISVLLRWSGGKKKERGKENTKEWRDTGRKRENKRDRVIGRKR